MYDKILAKGNELGGIKKSLFFWAVNLGLRYKPYGENGWWYERKLSLANKLIFSKWRQALGGNIKIMVSGGAAIQPRLVRIFTAAGLPIMEGYGQTETSPVIAVSDIRNGGFRIGAVGKVLDGVSVKIASDGEILVKGPNVMKGYYKNPEKTDDVFKDGFYCTGDIGEMDADGFLYITGRKKEMFKTSGGKYIVPAVIENQLKHSPFIEQVMVIGEGQKMPAAIIQPNFEFLEEWAKRKNISFKTHIDLISNLKAIKRIEKEIAVSNEQFGKWEQIKEFRLTPEEWAVDNDLLTAKLSMKRKNIEDRYAELIDEIYS